MVGDEVYDCDARQATPLARRLAAHIAAHGPIPVHDYVGRCLQDEEFGYYRSGDRLGAVGDFVTAPDISQVFGELIGAWITVVWQSLGRPLHWRIAELGPGRGTLMRDILRVLQRSGAHTNGLAVELVETNATLRHRQQAALAGSEPRLTWTDTLPRPTLLPTILIANEFLDCLPPVQWILTETGWRRRCVGLDQRGRLAFVAGNDDVAPPPTATGLAGAPVGSIFEEHRPGPVADAVDALATAAPLAALFIDYGHSAPGLGDTLQAVRNHAFEHPLTTPGEADLTTHVDFAAYAAAFAEIGLHIHGPLTQGEFLGRLGIVERTARLMSANPFSAPAIESGTARLISPAGMGSRFKALGVRSGRLPPLPGF